MTKQPQRMRPKFTGALLQPIHERDKRAFVRCEHGRFIGIGTDPGSAAWDIIDTAEASKVFDLAERYGLDFNDVNFWIRLSLCMARDLVPGFTIIKKNDRTGRAGRLPIRQRDSLFDAYIALLNQGLKPTTAKRVLKERPEWKANWPNNFNQRYAEYRKRKTQAIHSADPKEYENSTLQ